LINKPEISILKTSESDVIYMGGVATYRGFIWAFGRFKLNSFGGRITEYGIFKFEIYQLDELLSSPIDTLLFTLIQNSILKQNIPPAHFTETNRPSLSRVCKQNIPPAISGDKKASNN